MIDELAPGEAESPFIDPVAMEDDPEELFAGDRGVLDQAVRRVLVDVVEPGDWEALGRAMKAVLAVADSDT